MPSALVPEDFIDDAAKIGCSVAAIRAVAEVESSGSGFDSKGRPKTLLEGHLFYKYTKGAYAKQYPSICYPTWTKRYYGKTRDQEWARLQQAIKLNRKAALLSTSWGTFQILGANYAACGYTDVEDFVLDMHKDSNKHLEIFTEFVIHSGLADELRDLRFADFARIYNGPSYRANAYDAKMLAAYNKFKEEEPTYNNFWQPLDEFPTDASVTQLASFTTPSLDLELP